jgi:hypothetical protein
MADDLPTPAKGVYLFFEFIALGFALGAVEEFLRGSSWHSWVLALALAAAFLFLGVVGPKLTVCQVYYCLRIRTREDSTRHPWPSLKNCKRFSPALGT